MSPHRPQRHEQKPSVFKPTRDTVELRPDGRLTAGVVADTHSLAHQGGLRALAALAPDLILHAGDIGDLGVLAQLSAIAPVLAVRGNIDPADCGQPETRIISFTHRGVRVLTCALLHIAVAGPRIRADAAKFARAEEASLILCGHSHVPFLTQEKGLTLFNPGSMGPRRASLPILFGVMDIGASISLRHIDCVSGNVWLP